MIVFDTVDETYHRMSVREEEDVTSSEGCVTLGTRDCTSELISRSTDGVGVTMLDQSPEGTPSSQMERFTEGVGGATEGSRSTTETFPDRGVTVTPGGSVAVVS